MKKTFFFVFLSLWMGLASQAQQKETLPIKAEISDSIDVLHYDIHLDLVHLSTKSITGFTDLEIVAKLPLTTFRLWLQQLVVDSVIVNGASATVGYNDTLITILPATSFNIGDTFQTRVYYHGQPVVDPSGWGGFYFTADSNWAFNLGVGFESVPHNYGRVWFPCIDDFVDRATYDEYITTKDDFMAVCGGNLLSGVDNGDNTITWHWQMIRTIPTYLASVAVGKYVAVADTFHGMAGDVPTFLYVRVTDTTNAKNSFVHLNDILTTYESRFGPYRFERVGYVGVPFSNGAMEHATNIAYPLVCINGTTAYEDLYSHELSHMWFGDAVTCATAEDMWINEGWARYCEAIAREGVYGNASYKTYLQTLLKDVIQFLHVTDNGYRAIYGIPPEYTYGNTVYDKGGMVAATLRGYLGDSTFFSVMKKYFDDHAYDHISSTEFRDYLTAETGVDMTAFFDTWVFSPGFPHFSVDSFNVSGSGPASVTVYVRQRLDHLPLYANNNNVEITFKNDTWQSFTDTLHFSGALGQKTFTVPFAPTVVLMDADDKIADAITAHGTTVKTTGQISFPTTYCTLDVTSVADSAWVRIEHNFVPPDPLKVPDPDIDRLSDHRYWKVDGIFPAGFITKAKFRYNRTTSTTTGYLDNTLMTTTGSKDSLRLLYRTGPESDWETIPFTIAGTSTAGDMIVDTLRKGEYTFAIGVPISFGIRGNEPGLEKGIHIFPNPSDSDFTIEWKYRDVTRIQILNFKGKIVEEIPVANKQRVVWEPGNKSSGIYVVKFYDAQGAVIGQEKIVYAK